MTIKTSSVKRNSNLSHISESIKNKFGIIVLITFATIFLTNYMVNKINSYMAFKAKTILDGSRGASFDVITNLENNFNSFLTAGSNLSDSKLQIKNINYFDLYLQIFNKKLFIKLIDENNFLNKKDYASETDYLNAITNLYENNFELKVEKKLIYQDKITNSLWSIGFTGPLEKKEQWDKILKELKKISHEKFKNKILETIKAKLLLVNAVTDNNIELIDNKTKFYLNEHFHFKNQELLVYLKEQANIARELGIDNGLQYLKGSDMSEIFNLYDERGVEFLTFQWGFIAIEKKISDVLSRDFSQAKYFVKEYEELMTKKNELVQSKNFYNTLYEDSLKNSPFLNNESVEDLFFVSTDFKSNKINLVTNILLNILFIIIVNITFVAITLLINGKKT